MATFKPGALWAKLRRKRRKVDAPLLTNEPASEPASERIFGLRLTLGEGNALDVSSLAPDGAPAGGAGAPAAATPEADGPQAPRDRAPAMGEVSDKLADDGGEEHELESEGEGDEEGWDDDGYDACAAGEGEAHEDDGEEGVHAEEALHASREAPSAFDVLMRSARRVPPSAAPARNAFTVLMTAARVRPPATANARPARGGGHGGWATRTPPPAQKHVPGTSFLVDAFMHAPGPCRTHFLTHFHADHYGGLTKRFSAGIIFCSAVTARLVTLRLGVPRALLRILQIGEAQTIDGVRVTALDANHCPGAVMLLFGLRDGRHVLHTGDMRWRRAMALEAPLAGITLSTLYLDTTYVDVDFPPQDAVVRAVVQRAVDYRESSRTLIAFGAYSIGKERLFLAVAAALRERIGVDPARLRTYRAALADAVDVERVFTTDQGARIRVVSMHVVALHRLSSLVGGRWSSVVGFRPTGWTAQSRSATPGGMLRTQRRGPVTLVSVPYSEHSSLSELRDCVRTLRPVNVVPTVGGVSPEARVRILEAVAGSGQL